MFGSDFRQGHQIQFNDLPYSAGRRKLALNLNQALIFHVRIEERLHDDVRRHERRIAEHSRFRRDEDRIARAPGLVAAAEPRYWGIAGRRALSLFGGSPAGKVSAPGRSCSRRAQSRVLDREMVPRGKSPRPRLVDAGLQCLGCAPNLIQRHNGRILRAHDFAGGSCIAQFA